MLKLLLIKELFIEDISKSIILSIFDYDFIFGRCYQLVIDRTPNIKATGFAKRKLQTLNYIRKMTDIEIIEEAFSIIRTKTTKHSCWYDLIVEYHFDSDDDRFYCGRIEQRSLFNFELEQPELRRSRRHYRGAYDWVNKINK